MVSEAASTVLDGETGLESTSYMSYNETNTTAEYTAEEVLTSLCLLCGIIQVNLNF